MNLDNIADNKNLVYFSLSFVVVVWSVGWIISKQALSYIPPFSMAALRFLVATITMYFIIKQMAIKQSYTHKEKLWLMLVGLMQTTLFFGLINYALMYEDVGKASILIYSMPVWSSFFAYLILKEKTGLWGGSAIFIGFVGVLLVAFSDFISIEKSKGSLLIILAAIIWGMSNVIFKNLFKEKNKLSICLWQMFFGFIGLITLSIIFEGEKTIIINKFSLFTIFYTGVLASAISFSIWFWVIANTEIYKSSLALLCIPVISVILDVLVNQTNPNTLMLFGLGLIAFGGAFPFVSRRHS